MRKLIKRDQMEWILFVFAIVLGTGLSANFLFIERATISSGEHERLRIQADIAGEVLERQIDGIRQTLLQLQSGWQHSSRTLRLLDATALKQTVTGLVVLMVVDSKGKVLATSSPNQHPHLLDVSYLRSLSELSDPEQTYMAQPFIDKHGDSTVKISLVDKYASQPQRIFTAVVRMEYFDAVLRSINASGETTTSLKVREGPAFAEKHGGTVMSSLDFTDDAYSLGVRRLINSEQIRLNAPLVLDITRRREIVEKPWRELAKTYLSAMLAIAALGAAAMRGIQKRRRIYFQLLRRRAEERSEQAERMALTLSSAKLGLWDLSFPDLKLILDERAAQIQGTSGLMHQLPAAGWRDWIHPDDLVVFEQAVQTHIDSTSPTFECEYRILKPAGDWAWVHCAGKVVARDEKNRPLRMLGTLMDIRRRKANEQEIERLAYYDSLTNLPNRRLLLARLENALRDCRNQRHYGALLFIDLDNFKSLNDTLGHNQGDLLLQQVALRLCTITRRTDTVSRHGGDEFVVLLDAVGSDIVEASEVVTRLGHAILQSLGLQYSLNGRDIYSTPSIGATIFDATYQSVEDVLKHADMAMYEAKAAGRNMLMHFDPCMQRALDYETELERDLRSAIARRAFTLHYQPIHDRGGTIVGAEALIRWPSSPDQYRSPAEFIPLAEKTGLIVEIGDQVLEMACQQIALWRHISEPKLIPISVNVSPRQIRQPDFVAKISELLSRYKAPPASLKLELTEGVFVSDAKDVIEKMEALQALGVAFSLDDFGTGYSSLSYLRNLPLSQLKIDRSFVDRLPGNEQDGVIVKTIIGLAGNLGLDVVAEGVETAEQLQFLHAHGCQQFQGYFLSRPQLAEQLDHTLKQH